ncbi:calcium/sodium antiporter [Candidatus Peregrinibacteria bacterium]|nr:calcium/sodium antiporter [Candidatus Peregrinibacteria bacterium]MBT3599051.1 calcium/sodium antiporter [Candidatus Peregrinibacteria bacterium]MBT4367288.1 calcium/sodium antiporter [Candidatus Peregrinibacteria bacterium]MBT4585599.1 calcium/sodium antiporter [Candidatus Peregrinibacteria bacterium]MBT6730643.1 calcium/sodium antiporter [Candidatus Peregrinibacteria bacterium]
MQFLLFVIGLFLLIKGADLLVEGSSSFARKIGVSDLVIGLTVVSFGTSAPELLVNVVASLKGSADIAIGNIVGSNISNTLLILGATAAVTPLAIRKSTVLKEIPFSILAGIMLLIMANDSILDGIDGSWLTRSDGLVFLGFFIIFLYYTFGIRNDHKEDANHTEDPRPMWLAAIMIFGGLAGLVGGGTLAVNTAQEMALALGVSEAFVGLTAIAIGTSLPELTASMVAALKKKPDMAVGNIVGSNIFNILWILGLSSLIKPIPFSTDLNIDLLVVLLSAIGLFVIVHNGQMHRRIFLWWKQSKDFVLSRTEGVTLILCYIAYIVYVGYRG